MFFPLSLSLSLPVSAEPAKRQRLDDKGLDDFSHGSHYLRTGGFGLSDPQLHQTRPPAPGNPLDYTKHPATEPRALGSGSGQLPIPKEWMTEPLKIQQSDTYTNIGRKNWNSPVRFANSPRTSTCSSSLEGAIRHFQCFGRLHCNSFNMEECLLANPIGKSAGYSQGHSHSPTDPSLLSSLSRRPATQRSRKIRSISDIPPGHGESLQINENLGDLHDPSSQSPTKKIKISRETVREHVHLPIQEAAKLIGVCPTVLKKQCRQLGIRRWPYRKVTLVIYPFESN